MRRLQVPGFSAAIPLGEGGQSRTFLCWQDDPGRWVVLKADPKDRGELEAEAELLERLPGAPVPALLARNTGGGNPWIAMSWIDGIRLDHLPGDLGIDDVLPILSATARAVAILHSRGIVHGDLAPSNIIALPSGDVTLVDLGMASIGGSRTGGTWETLPPERIQGFPASNASDVFALGVLALRLLGRLPPEWTDTRDRWSQALLAEQLPTLAPDLPVVAAATATTPESRPTAMEFANGLDTHLRHWPRERLRRKAKHALDDLLCEGIQQAVQRNAWGDAWRMQRERIERSDDPEPLLPELGRFARERDAWKPRRKAYLWLASALLAILGVAMASILSPRPGTAVPRKAPSRLRNLSAEDFPRISSIPLESFPLPSVPPGASLRVDGIPTDMPDEGTLVLAEGRHRIQLRDAVGNLLLDTIWIALPARRQHLLDSTPEIHR